MNKVKPLLEVAIEGEGLSPADVPVRQLVELLEATVSAVEAVARENGMDPPELRLIDVRSGSAAYDMYSDSPTAEAVVKEFYAVARDRGKESGPGVRKALSRLHSAGKHGSVRLALKSTSGKRPPKPIRLAPPIQHADYTLEAEDELYGRIVGLYVKNDTTHVRIKIDDGKTEEFLVEGQNDDAVAHLFNKTVRAVVTYDITGTDVVGGTMDMVSPWEEEDLISVLQSARNELAAEGHTIDAEEWLRELDA